MFSALHIDTHTVFVWEPVLDVISKESQYRGGDAGLLFGDVLVMLCVISLTDR